MPEDENDEQYKKATRVVDDAMRTDTLGPNLCKVLEDHKPANDMVKKIIKDSISNDSKVRAALTDFVKDDRTLQKGRWVERAVIVATSAAVTLIIAYIAGHFHLS